MAVTLRSWASEVAGSVERAAAAAAAARKVERGVLMGESMVRLVGVVMRVLWCIKGLSAKVV